MRAPQRIAAATRHNDRGLADSGGVRTAPRWCEQFREVVAYAGVFTEAELLALARRDLLAGLPVGQHDAAQAHALGATLQLRIEDRLHRRVGDGDDGPPLARLPVPTPVRRDGVPREMDRVIHQTLKMRDLGWIDRRVCREVVRQVVRRAIPARGVATGQLNAERFDQWPIRFRGVRADVSTELLP